MPLTDAAIRNARPNDCPIKLKDGGGLYLEVRPTGSKLWRYRYRIAGRENVFAIGEYPLVTLADARRHRVEARELVKKGIHPSHHCRAAALTIQAQNASTFEAVAREWIAKKKQNCTPYYIRQIETFMAADIFPHIGKLPIRAVTPAHLLELLQRVEQRGAETVAVNLRQWCSAIFRYAASTSRADSDPAAALKGAIQRPVTEHCKPLSRAEIAQFFDSLASFGGYRMTVIALQLMLHYVLPNFRDPDRCMRATTLNRALERMGLNGRDTIGFSAHGFRANQWI